MGIYNILYPFGMATLLDDIPVLHLLTNVLDANNPAAKAEIAKFLAMFRACMKSQAEKLQHCFPTLTSAQNIESPRFSFNKSRYHLKRKIFNRFPAIAVERQALPLLWDVFETLSGLDEVVKPLGYGELIGIENGDRCLFFNNLYGEGFVMGVPSDEQIYLPFCEALMLLTRKIHARGVIHVDLYPSNILWLYQDGEIKIRLIDWDAATFKGQTYPDSMMKRFNGCKHPYYVPEPVAKAENDAWHVFILTKLKPDQRKSLQGTSASEACKVNSAYQRCISEKIPEGDIEELHKAFLSWFQEHFSGHAAAAQD